MKQIFFLLVLSLSSLFWHQPTAMAQPGSTTDTTALIQDETRGEEISTECTSDLSPCIFKCRAGDVVLVSGDFQVTFTSGGIVVTAYCNDDPTVSCQGSRRYAGMGRYDARCSATSDVIEESGEGLCYLEADGLRYGSFRCRSVTPDEAAKP